MAAPYPSIDQVTLIDLYLERRMSQPAIAKHLGKGERTVRRLMQRYGIIGRRCIGKDNPRFSHVLTVGQGEYRKHRKTRCETCSSTSSLCVHHKNDDHFDNRPEN